MVQNSRRWMEASDVIPMFPSLVWKVQVEARLRDALRATILAALAGIRAGLPPLAAGAAHKLHSHPNNFLSGVYYVGTRPGADTINFHDPRRQTGVIRPPVVELSAENTDQVVLEVQDGCLLMFPSWLEHSVDANTSSEERISLSFNVMFSSFAEHLSQPLWSAEPPTLHPQDSSRGNP